MSLYICVGLSILLSLISMPLVICFCKKFSLYDYQSARKIHSGNIPRLGGVGIVLSFLISVIIFLTVSKDIPILKHLPILIAAVIIFLFAIIDDLFNLPAIVKLIVQIVAVSVVCFNGYRFTQVFGLKLPTVISFLLTFGWILGLINAYNLIDGLDGLCGTLSISTIITLGILFAISGNDEAGICFILAGSIFGFLCFNWPPAKLFMGDNGSQFLGFMIATLPLYTSSDVFERNKFLIMIVLTAFPVFDTIAAIWRRIRDKKPIMSPDRLHLHHKLLNLGYSGRNALILVLCLQTVLCATVIVSIFLGEMKGQALLIEAFVFMILFFSLIHFSNRKRVLDQSKENKTEETPSGEKNHSAEVKSETETK